MQVTSLKSYLCEVGMTIAQFSELMECSRQHMHGIVKKRTYPSARLARDIFHMTNGVVNIPTKPKKVKEPVEEIAKI
jgi:hypothetical protein